MTIGWNRRRDFKRLAAPACALFFTALLATSPADADPSPSERAAAEALFQQATSLMQDKQFAKACEKFEGSNQLDPALGTMLRLADCFDRVGKTASAWVFFREAASLARTRNEGEREKIAADRAADLEKRLSKVELKTDVKSAPVGLEIRLNGAVIPRASWDAPIPVDPGKQQIDASAPERAPWSTTVDVVEGPALQSIDVPALVLKHAAGAAANGAPGAESVAVRGSAQRTLGYVAGGIALAGLATSAFLTWRAFDLKQQSLDHCRPEDVNACTQEGVDQRAAARQWATGATVAIGISVPLLAGGIFLLLSAPRTETAHVSARALSPTVGFVRSGATLGIKGRW
jgi:hypothetical protein